jgi:hypothetical protein
MRISARHRLQQTSDGISVLHLFLYAVPGELGASETR